MYRKMLEGFTDDLKFKDMIQVLTFGSSTQLASTSASEGDGNKDKSMPKVAEEHRLDILPIVVKLLLSKLIKKKGAIKQKTVHQRRHIVYGFMGSGLQGEKEVEIFMDEMLSGVGIKITEDLSKEEVRDRLSRVSFSGYLNFIGSIEVIIKQMGS